MLRPELSLCRQKTGFPEKEAGVKILVTDVGYGDTKYALVENGNNMQGKIPTLVAPIVEPRGFGDSGCMSFGGRSFLVGEDARFAKYVIPTTTEEFLPTYSPLVLAKILKSKSPEGVDLVVVSLSLRDWEKKNRLEKSVAGFTVSGTSFTQEVKVFPQGLGIWVDQGSPENAMVVDIGFNTVDVLIVVDGRPRKDLSFAISGMGTTAFLSDVTEFINRRAREDFTTNEVADLVQKKSPLLQRFGVLDEVKARAVNWFGDVWGRLLSRPVFSRGLKLLDTVVVAGGGARFIQSLPDSRVKVVKEEPEFANVRGFLAKIRDELSNARGNQDDSPGTPKS